MNGLLYLTSYQDWKRIVFALVVIVVTGPVYAQVRLVADLDRSPIGFAGHLYLHETSAERAFFMEGTGLYTSDGTAEGTRFIRDFFQVTELEVIEGIAYISAHTNGLGCELWRSDGTLAGTTLIKDIYPGSGSATPSFLTNFNGLLYFSANNRDNGRELWRSDGTPGGTQLVADLEGGGSVSSNPAKFIVAGNKLFFVANNGLSGYELFVSDGTTAGTRLVKDIFPGFGSSAPGAMTNVNGLLLFSASAPGIDRQLWKSDGTREGTHLVKIIRRGKKSARIDKMVNLDGTAFFRATDGLHGIELWKSDGTHVGTKLVKDITPGPGSTSAYASEHIDNLAPAIGKLFFTAVSEDERERVWVSDGTDEGTFPITDRELGFAFSEPGFREGNGAVLFFGVSKGTHLYKSDGKSVTLVKENVGDFFFTDPMFAPLNGKHYFLGYDQYWKTDGTSAGTQAIKRLGYPAGVMPSHLTDMGGTLIFGTVYPYDGLWKTDGTEASTVKVGDFPSPYPILSFGDKVFFNDRRNVWVSDGTDAGTFVVLRETEVFDDHASANGLKFFSAIGPEVGWELWQSDGTVSGTKPTKDINSGPIGSMPRNVTAVGNLVFFTATVEATGEELWKTDGTTEGTQLVRDIIPGPGYPSMTKFISFKDQLFFEVRIGANGPELWKSDGTSEGTKMVNELQGGVLGNYLPREMMATSQDLFFSDFNENGKTSLWKSNGSAETTIKLADFETTKLAQMLGTIDSQIFFAVHFSQVGPTSNYYTELWVSNGTPAGTRKLKKIGAPGKAAVLGDVIYFSAGHYLTGAPLIWRSNGQPSGTYTIPFDGFIDITEGFTASGPYVYFSGITRAHGRELFLIDEGISAASAIEAVVTEPSTDGETILNYPNPFSSTFLLNVKGESNETFALSVLTSTGAKAGTTENLSCNVDHIFGGTLKPGVYILKIRKSGKTITRRIVKVN
jgi:ELWxxDGT repeat protein